MVIFAPKITLRYVRAGQGRFIVLNDSDSPKLVIQINFNFLSDFLKVLELIECRGGDPYRTANRNFIRFVHT